MNWQRSESLQPPAYPTQSWYVAATSDEVTSDPLGRRALDTALVLYRTSDGSVIVLEDRDVHRPYPLSLGRVEDDLIISSYTGFAYAADGACVRVPTQHEVPYDARVRAYPVREQDGLVWVWFAEAGLASLHKPPNAPWLVDSAWSTLGGEWTTDANFLLLHENFADITHVAVVDPDFAPPVLTAGPVPLLEVEVTETTVSFQRDYPTAPLAAWHANLLGADPSTEFTQHEEGRFVSPGLWVDSWEVRPSAWCSLGGHLPVHPRGDPRRRDQHPTRLAGEPQLRSGGADLRGPGPAVHPVLQPGARHPRDDAGRARHRRAACRRQRRLRRGRPAGSQDRRPHDLGRTIRMNTTQQAHRHRHPARPRLRRNEMTDVKGFFYPRTALGGSSLIPDPPWFYSGDLLTVEYRTDPARVAELLPAPLEPAPEDPGAVALIWADWQSCSSSREELLDPVRSQYKETFVVVRCSFEGKTFSRCVYIWVDKDFAIARGMHQGYPKKLGTMWQTRPHPFLNAAPQIAEGGIFGATLAAGDRRLAEAVLTLREESDSNGFVNSHPMAHHRIYPGIERGTPDAYAELISSGAAEFEGGPAWKGDVDLRLFESPTEELARLEVDEIIGGYYRQVGVTWDGGGSLAQRSATEGWKAVRG